MWRRFTRVIPVLIAVVLLPSLTSGSALAQTRIDPARFALPSSFFPPGSHVVRAGVETNGLLKRDEAGHFGVPAAALGRLTGYYMDAVEGDQAAAIRTYTSYLLSIFRTIPQAQAAFDFRWDTWFSQTYYTNPQPLPVSVGDNGSGVLFHTLDPSQPPLSELMFRRGTILVEVFQGTGAGLVTAAETHALYRIARKLDALARQR